MNQISMGALKTFYKEDLDEDPSVLQSLTKILESQLAELSSLGVTNNDLRPLGSMAHKVKSSARSFGLFEVEKNLALIEDYCRAGDSDKAVELFFHVKEVIPSIIEELNEAFLELTGRSY